MTTVTAHTGARLWSTRITSEDGQWVFRDSQTGELIGTCPVSTGEWIIRDPHTGESMGAIQSDRSKPITREHARVAFEYLLGFANEEDISIASCAITLMNYIHTLEESR